MWDVGSGKWEVRSDIMTKMKLINFMTHCISRIYYRNTFLHIGHLLTLYYNNDYARKNNGICFAIIDDRQDEDAPEQVRSILNYLEIDKITVVEVSKYMEYIAEFNLELLKKAKIKLVETNTENTIPVNSVKELLYPKTSCQLVIDSITVAFTKWNGSYYLMNFTFEYIIHIMDILLKVTDINSTSTHDIMPSMLDDFFRSLKCNTINIHRIRTYKISGFKYCKDNWPPIDTDDMRLLTLTGLKARKFPASVLYAFYNHGMQSGCLNVAYLDILLRNYLSINSEPIFAVIDPLKVKILNWEEGTTEFILKNKRYPDNSFLIVPLSDTFYIERSHFSMTASVDKFCLHTEARMKNGNVIYCTDVIANDDGEPVELHVKYYPKDSKVDRNVSWVSYIYDTQPVKAKVCFVNGFYTGLNLLTGIRVENNCLIEPSTITDSSKYYYLEKIGYLVKDEELSKDGVPYFIRLCEIRN